MQFLRGGGGVFGIVRKAKALRTVYRGIGQNAIFNFLFTFTGAWGGFSRE